MTAVALETLLREHRDLELLLAALARQIQVFAEDGSPDYDVVRGVADYLLEYPDRCHHPKEDIVFARLVEAHPHRAVELSGLARDHQRLRQKAEWFAATVHALLNESDIPRDTIVAAARSYIQAQRRHIWDEEQHYFPLAGRLLSEADWLAIDGELARRSDDALASRAEREFSQLRQKLLAWEKESGPNPVSPA